MSNGNDQDDLYGDLDHKKINKSSIARSNPRQINIHQEREEIQSLKQENEALKRENEILKRNMGILYRTAKLELQRKEAQLEEAMTRKRLD